MKQKVLFVCVAFACLCLFSCGSSIDGDAKKLADLKCDAEKMMRRVNSGETAMQAESDKLKQDAANLYEELQKKYAGKEEHAKFMKAFIDESSKCQP